MSRLLFLRDPLVPEQGMATLPPDGGQTEAIVVDGFKEVIERVANEEFDALFVPFDANDAQSVERLDALRGVVVDIPVVCVVADEDYESLALALRRQRVDAIFSGQLYSEHAPIIVGSVLERADAQTRAAALERQLDRRHSELLGLNALASAVTSSLERSLITRRALWVFGGLCRRGAAALVQIEPTPPLPEDEAEQDDEKGGEEDVEPTLHCVGQFAVDGEPVCTDFERLDWWLDMIYEDEIVIYDDPPAPIELPALEPLLQRASDGVVVLVPIWGQGRPLGLFVLSELAPGDEFFFTHEALRAMSSQLGGALENARLFEEVNSAYQSLRSTQDQLVHAEKFAAMGVLAAEIAHEINNPASFVISNLSVMVDYVDTIGRFLEEMKGELDDKSPELAARWEALSRDYEIDFLREDVDTLLSRSMGGMQRIHQIVQDLRFFSHDTENEPGWIDIESLLEATINLARHEAKYRARLELDFGGVPQIFSDPNRLCQVLLNLLVNAAHAIESGAHEDNEIRVQTRRRGPNVIIRISDTGKGIDPDVMPRIFEPFFTTKAQGEGTGLGLSISRDIVRSLGGKITVTSQVGEGSTFSVVLPIRAPQFEKDETIRESGSYAAPPFQLRDNSDEPTHNASDA